MESMMRMCCLFLFGSLFWIRIDATKCYIIEPLCYVVRFFYGFQQIRIKKNKIKNDEIIF